MTYDVDHVRAFYLHKALSIPGGASNTNVFQVGEYWRFIRHWVTYEGMAIGF